MDFLQDTAIVLRSQVYLERDRLLTLLTENHGRISAVAKGAVHSKRFGGAFDLFTCIEFRGKDSPSQSLVRIDEAKIKRDFLGLRERLENMSAAGYFVDLCLRLSEERQACREIFLLLAHYLFLIEENAVTREIVRSFEIKLLDRLGYGPQLGSCISCENILGLAPHVGLAVDRGGFLCEQCSGSSSRLVPHETLSWLQAARETPVRDLGSLQFPAETTNEGARVLMPFLRYHLPGLGNYEFRSHSLLEQFLGE